MNCGNESQNLNEILDETTSRWIVLMDWVVKKAFSPREKCGLKRTRGEDVSSRVGILCLHSARSWNVGVTIAIGRTFGPTHRKVISPPRGCYCCSSTAGRNQKAGRGIVGFRFRLPVETQPSGSIDNETISPFITNEYVLNSQLV